MQEENRSAMEAPCEGRGSSFPTHSREDGKKSLTGGSRENGGALQSPKDGPRTEATEPNHAIGLAVELLGFPAQCRNAEHRPQEDRFVC